MRYFELTEALNLFNLHSDSSQLSNNDRADEVPALAWEKIQYLGPHELLKRKAFWATDPDIAVKFAAYLKQFAPSMIWNEKTGYRFIEAEPLIFTKGQARSIRQYLSYVVEDALPSRELLILENPEVVEWYVVKFYPEQFNAFLSRRPVHPAEGRLSKLARQFLILKMSNQLDEGWKEKVAAAGAGAAVATVSNLGQLDQPDFVTPNRIATGHIAKPFVTKMNPDDLRNYITAKAKKAGIVGPELRHFVSQLAHETLDFKRMIEAGDSRYFQKRYDIKFNPKRAKVIGNLKPGDGERYIGRGFIQLTGRYNYKKAGEALGIPLEANPELALRLDVATDVAIWYWRHRVKSRIKNFNAATVKDVTSHINPNLHGMDSRMKQYHALANLHENN